MNVYDFDKTIFYPDSMYLFVKFCIRRHPKLCLHYFPRLLKAVYLYKTGKKARVYIDATANTVIRYLDHPDEDIAAFWEKYIHNLSAWYLLQKKDDDLIISASPEYLLKPLTDQLGVHLIGTIVDKETGVMTGNVRIAREKARYIIEQDMPMIDNFYSDSLSDTPIALLAEKAYLVTDKARRPIPWPHIDEKLMKVVYKKIDIEKPAKNS